MRSRSRCQPDWLSRDRQRLILPAALALAATLAACGPTPIGTPMPAPYPGATGTAAAPYPLGTPMTPTRLPDTPTPAGVPVAVALTLGEAAEQSLWLVNPLTEPRVAFSHYVRAGDVLSSHVIFGSNRMYALEELGVDAPVIVVGMEAKHPTDRSAGSRAQMDVEWPQWAGAVFEAATGKLVQAGRLEVGGLGEPLATLAAVPTAVMTPVRIPSPLPTLFVPFTPMPESTATTLPDDLRTLLPSSLRGKPLTRSAVDASVLATLRDWPLLPGNQWVYQNDMSDDGVWARETITETVVAAEVLRPDVVVVVSRETTSAAPAAAEILARSWRYAYSGPTLTLPIQPRESTVWHVIHGGDVYMASEVETMEAIMGSVIGYEPTTTLSRDPSLIGYPKPVPMVRFPLVIGDFRPDSELGGDLTIEAEEPIQTWAGRLEGCFRDFHTGNLEGYSWYCPGVGLARWVTRHTTFQFDRQLSDYDISTTVDDLP